MWLGFLLLLCASFVIMEFILAKKISQKKMGISRRIIWEL